MDEHEMTKDILGDGHDSDKHSHSRDFDELDEIDSSSNKKSRKYKKVRGHEKIGKDHDGKFIDDYKEEYHKTKHDIIDTLDTHTRSKKYYHRGEYDDDFLSRKEYKRGGLDEEFQDDFHGRHLSEEEWTLKEKKERDNLNELISKEHELEAAAKDVKAAQDSLSSEKKHIDDEINGKIKETENMRKDFERKASARAEAERRSAELREKVELEERQKDKQRRTQ